MTAQNEMRVEHSRKRVRILLAGELVADTTGPLLVWEVPYYPTYYIPASDVRAELVPYGSDAHKVLGEAEVLTVKVPSGAAAVGAARKYLGMRTACVIVVLLWASSAGRWMR